MKVVLLCRVSAMTEYWLVIRKLYKYSHIK